jgi:hypothetical protein
VLPLHFKLKIFFASSPANSYNNSDFLFVVVALTSVAVAKVLPISVTVGDKGYDSENNHILIREHLHAFSVISARFEHIPIWRTHGKYRKQMKRGYSKILYHQRNKNETIISVIKRLFGECLTSRELSFRCIAYNMHRLTNLVIIVMVST